MSVKRYIYIDVFKAMDMKQGPALIRRRSGLQPSSDVELYLFTGKKVKKIKRRLYTILPCYEFECFKWRVVCSPVRTQGCRKQQQGYLFHSYAIIPHKSSQQHTLGF